MTLLTGRQIRKATRAAVAALEDNGYYCCLFGSAACAIYGTENREPNDVDIIVLTQDDPEDIKNRLVSTNDDFYLVPSANPNNTYRILWYSLSARRACKVDILIPGLLSIPYIPRRRIVYQEPFADIPVAPFLVLLLLKLRGWTDHRADNRQRMRDKVPEDEEDIDELLELAVEEYQVHIRGERWIPGWFIDEARERVDEYVQERPDTADSWSEIGLFN